MTEDERDDLMGDLTALEAAARAFGATLTGGLRAAVVEGKALDEVLKAMVLRLSSRVLDAALKPLADLLGGLVGGGGGGLLGGLLGGVTPFARGGVIATPTYFPTAGGAGLAGEAGAEAILPLSRAADGSLGVRGGGGVAVTLNVTTPDADSFVRSEAQVRTMLARAVGRGRRGL